MRWIVLATVAALASAGVDAADPGMAPLPAPVPIAEPEPVVTVTVIPAQERESNVVATVNLTTTATTFPELAAMAHPITGSASEAALSPPANLYSEVRPPKKLTSRKVNKLNRALFSRTARHQMALLASTRKTKEATLAGLFNNDDAESGADAIDIQTFYKRPKLVRAADQDGNSQISDKVKLRLFIARMRAVEAHRMAHFATQQDDADEEMSDAIKLRLFLARMSAVDAHRRKFS